MAVLKHGNWKTPRNGGFKGEVIELNGAAARSAAQGQVEWSEAHPVTPRHVYQRHRRLGKAKLGNDTGTADRWGLK